MDQKPSTRLPDEIIVKKKVVKNLDPHIGSFIPDPKSSAESTPDVGLESEVNPEGVEITDEVDEEEKKDATLSIVFTLIAALTVIACIGFYINHYIEPSKNSIIPELLVDISEGAPNSETSPIVQKSESDIAEDELIKEYNKRLAEQKTIRENEELFAKQNSTTTGTTTKAVFVVTEEIVRATSSIPVSRTQSLSEQATSVELGISYVKDPYWKQTIKGDTITLRSVGPTGKDVITMTKFSGTSVTTEDSVNGNVTYFYDNSGKTWMRIDYAKQLSSEETIKPQAFTPIHFTRYNKPIFDGTSRSQTLIIAFSVNDFLIVNISGTGYTSILNAFVSAIHSIR